MDASIVRLLTAVVAVMLLAEWQGSFAAAQGITSSMETMHSSGQAAAAEADTFFELVALAMRSAVNISTESQSKGKFNASFISLTNFKALQDATYQVASSYQHYGSWDPAQNPQGINLLPQVRDQGECYTAVAHAVAAAVEAAVAAATGTNASQWDVSPELLHYCSGQNRTCTNSWTLQEALDVVTDKSPELVRPTKCNRIGSTGSLSNITYAAAATAQEWADVCSVVQQQCSDITRATPWLQCSYKPLRTFWEIQQHVRQHGAVLTTMTVYDDFDLHFKAAVKGRHATPYRPGTSASILYSQAALIVGYSNVASAQYEPSFTVLTPWGTRRTHAGPRRAAITTDGLYRIAMGAAGVGSPDNTWGVQCHPAPGSELDPHSTQSWKAATVKLVEVAEGDQQQNFTQAGVCYSYTTQARDTPASISDAFNISVAQLVKDNMQFFKVTNRSYTFPFPMTPQQLKQVLTTVTNATAIYARLQSSKHFKPYVQCWMAAAQTPTTCYLENLTPCYNSNAARGMMRTVNSACVLHYPDLLAMRNSLTPGQVLRVCAGTYATSFNSAQLAVPRLSQPQALVELLGIVLGTDAAANYTVPAGMSYCNPKNYPQAWHAADAPVKLWSTAGAARYACDAEGYITYLSLEAGKSAATEAGKPGKSAAVDYTKLVNTLLRFRRLRVLEIAAYEGSLPPQLGALDSLERLTIRQHCLTGTIPSNYGLSWPKMTSFNVVPQQVNGSSDVTTAQDRPACGLGGSIPASMLTHLAPTLRQLQLQGNKLTGTLPAQTANMTQLCWLNLRSNNLSGPIPDVMQSMFAACSGKALLDLSYNTLSGVVPAGLSTLPAQKVVLSNNPLLTSCLNQPTSNSTKVEFAATSITKFCEVMHARQQQEQQQYEALAKYLPKLIPSHSAAIDDFLNQAPKNLSAWFQPNNPAVALTDTKTLRDPSGHGRISIVLARINNVAYITQITGNHVGLDASVLPELSRHLPRLQSYNFRFCDKAAANTSQNAATLPADLAQAAPASFQALSLANCHLQGSIPPQWSNWSSLEELWIWGNNITGTLPASWAGGMRSLRILYAERNQLGGMLPASWGSGVMPSKMFINLNTNPALFGSIPASWARFEGLVWIERTAIKSCVPEALMDNIITDDTYRVGDIACPSGPGSSPGAPSTDMPKPVAPIQPSPEPVYETPPVPGGFIDYQYIALRGIRDLLGGKAALPDWMDVPPAVAENDTGTMGYCKWPGISCNGNKQITALNLGQASSMTGTTATAVDLTRLMQHVKRFSSLHTLHLASLRLHGQLPADLAPQLKYLRYLNVSNNPEISGTLPKTWAALTSLQHLDVSGCGVSGPLPEGYAALQMLRIFRGSRTLLSGSLPKSWGLLSSLQELDISQANLTGGFPSWGNAAAMQAMAAAKVAAAKAAAAQAVATAAAAREVLAAAGEQQARVAVLQAALQSLHGSKGSADQPIVAVAMDGVDPMQALQAGVVQYRQALDMADAATAISTSLQAASHAAAASASQLESELQTSKGSGSPSVSTASTDLHRLTLGDITTLNKSRRTEAISLNKPFTMNSTGKAATCVSTRCRAALSLNSISNAGTATAAVMVGASLNTTATAASKQPALGSNRTPVTLDNLKQGIWSTPDPAENPNSTIAQYGTRGATTRVAEVQKLGSSSVTPASARSARPGCMPLRVLRLRGNRLTGRLPEDISNLQHLRTLDLTGNELSGSLPNSLADLAGLQELLLSGNCLDGMLPHYYARLSKLARLDLSSNAFRGMIPPTWVGMKAAVMINIANNQLVGPIPYDLILMAGSMHNLRCLVVYGNQFEQQSVQQLQMLLQNKPWSKLKLIAKPEMQHLCSRFGNSTTLRMPLCAARLHN